MSPAPTLLVTLPLDTSHRTHRQIERIFQDARPVYRVSTWNQENQERMRIRETDRLLFALSVAYGPRPPLSEIQIHLDAAGSVEQIVLQLWERCDQLEGEREKTLESWEAEAAEEWLPE